MIFRRVLLILAAVLALTPSLRAATDPPVVKKLAGGATLIVLPEPDSSLIAVDIFFRVGFAEEQDFKAPGIASLLARAWIGSVEGRSEGTIIADIGATGGSVGTSIGGDFTELYAVVPASEERFARAAQLLIFNLIGRPEFPEAAVRAARREQLRAITLEDDTLFAATLARVRGRLWDVSPYAGSPLGTRDAVVGLTPDRVRSFFSRYFSQDRAVIVVAGKVTPELAQRLVEANIAASGWPERKPLARSTAIAPERLTTTPRDVRVDRQARATYVMAGFLTPGTASGPKAQATLAVLDAVIGGGKTGRLFRNVRDTRGIGYDLGTVLNSGRYQGMLAGYIVAAGDVSDTRTALVDEMKSTITRPPDAAELARAKALVTGRYALRKERLKDRAFLIGYAEVMGLGADYDVNFDTLIQSVTAEDVTRLAQSILGGNYVVALTQPAPGEAQDQ